MRESLAAVALIRRRSGDQAHYLAQWNEGWQRYSLVGGHKRDDETFRDCLVREVQEELGLNEGAHYHVGNKPLARLQFEAWSERAREQTSYAFEVFGLEFVAPESEVLRLINLNSANRWLSRREIDAQETFEGKPISETVSRCIHAVPY